MKQRCYNPNATSYNLYGSRGITVCDRWKNSFENFYNDMGNPPYGCTLDRKDINKGYSPENCRWATFTEQNNNKRNNAYIAFNTKTMTLKQWSEELGLDYKILGLRINSLGWTIERAFTEPIRHKQRKLIQ